MPTPAQIAAARQYAPPLIAVGQVDRRGAKLRVVNKQAVAYAQRAGLALEDVYPGGLPQVRAIAPEEGTYESFAFAQTLGITPDELYPATFEGEAPKGLPWGWALAGFAIGACAGGPLWALAGGILGALK